MSNQEWDGQGVPPAGTIVEVLWDMQYHGSRKVVVVGYDEALHRVVYRDLDWSDLDYDSALLDCIRPARSAEEVAIGEMVKDVGGEIYDYVTRETICRAMYYAGYRKTEVPE